MRCDNCKFQGNKYLVYKNTIPKKECFTTDKKKIYDNDGNVIGCKGGKRNG